jgi:SAM-dependent methyltransferase
VTFLRTAKEITRDLIARAGLSRLHVSLRKLRGENVDHLLHASLSERFSAVYKNRVWIRARSDGSPSGSGSDLENTGSVRQYLAELLKSLSTQSLLDVGCGDFTWMKEIPFPFRYTGIDIVAEVIAANAKLYCSKQRSFLTLDATRDPLPMSDTILCREVLFHLSFQDIQRLLENCRKSGASFLIATSDSDLQYNADILSGDFRLLNLEKAPFFFPPPAHSIPDDGVSAGRRLSAWKLADLPVHR